MKSSIICITIDRAELTRACLTQALESTGTSDYELLVADNGSTDSAVIDAVRELGPAHHVLNGENRGVAGALNQLIALARGDYVVHIGNDITMPTGWLSEMLAYHEHIPSAGVVALHTVEALPPISLVAGFPVRLSKVVFGPKMVRRSLAGYEELSKYGLEDSALSLRLYYAGHYNFYLPHHVATHNGVGENDTGEYRRFKTEQLHLAAPRFNALVKEYCANDCSRY